MSKYNFELDLDSKNSLSLIINMINKNTKVLEFGPANGRLTKYLKEEKNCIVDIVEIDEKSGLEASKYSNKYFIGDKYGNIENYIWLEELKDEKYDYIIFADVLEHLYWPEDVLKKSKKLLANDGSILLSVPNVAHNSVIIDLINDDFKYNETGLLDNTHIRFFTYKSLIRMLNSVGLAAVKERGIFNRVGDNEIDNSYDCIDREVAKSLRQRDKSNLYQFVFETKKSDYYLSNTTLRSVNLEKNCEYQMICYIKGDKNDEYSDNKVFIKNISPNNVKETIELKEFGFINQIKIYPIKTNCIISNINLIKSKEGKEEVVGIDYMNFDIVSGNKYVFRTEQPQFYITINDEIDSISIEYDIIDYSTNKIDWIVDLLKEGQNINSEKIAKQSYKLREKESHIEVLSNKLREKESYIKELNNKVSKIETEIETIYRSSSWKIARRIINIFK